MSVLKLILKCIFGFHRSRPAGAAATAGAIIIVPGLAGDEGSLSVHSFQTSRRGRGGLQCTRQVQVCSAAVASAIASYLPLPVDCLAVVGGPGLGTQFNSRLLHLAAWPATPAATQAGNDPQLNVSVTE